MPESPTDITLDRLNREHPRRYWEQISETEFRSGYREDILVEVYWMEPYSCWMVHTIISSTRAGLLMRYSDWRGELKAKNRKVGISMPEGRTEITLARLIREHPRWHWEQTDETEFRGSELGFEGKPIEVYWLEFSGWMVNTNDKSTRTKRMMHYSDWQGGIKG